MLYGAVSCTEYVSIGVSSLGVPWVPWHPQILADQLILSQPGWQIMSTTLLCALPYFQNFLRPCTVYSVHSSNNTDHYSIAHRNLEMYVQPPYVIDGSYADPYIRLNPVTSQCFSLIIYPELHIGNFLGVGPEEEELLFCFLSLAISLPFVLSS